MTANIHEPTPQRSIRHTAAVGKDTRQKPFAGRWIVPVDTGDPIPATSPDYTPELQNNFVQVISPKQPWRFRLRYDGDLQFEGVLNASAAQNGDVAITLPGYIAEEPYFAPDNDQGYTTQVTIDGVTLLNAVAHVDTSTGEVDISWLTPGVAVHEIKVFEDINPVVVGDDKFVWEIPEDLDGAEIVKVDGFVSNPGGSSTQVAIRLGACGSPGSDILSTKIIIDAGECTAKDSGTQPVVNPGTIASWGELLHIDVDAAGSGAAGLGVHIIYAPAAIASVVITGAQGPPGGVTQFQGQYPGGPGAAGTPGGAGSGWVNTTNYVIGDVVQNGGTYYVATANHTATPLTEPGVGANWMTVWDILVYTAGDIVTNNNVVYVATVTHNATTITEPGVGINWETVWAPLFETAVYSGFDVVMNGGGFDLDTGVQAYIPVPFDCQIVEATLLADRAGSIVVDIWKDTYGAFQPTNADSITSASPPTLVSANKTTDVALTGWTTALSAGDVLAFVIESVTQIQFITAAIRVLRTP